VRNPAAFQAATKLARRSDAANPFAVVPDRRCARSGCAGGLLVERHEFQGSRLFSPRAFSIGVAPWRVLSGGENQSFAMPVWDRQIFFKKPLASGRVFDIFSVPFRPKD
jgi:hypothetical protein